jgi:hypothetical protein
MSELANRLVKGVKAVVLDGGERFARLPSFRTADRRRRAFFVTYGASHVAKVAPVVRELERRGVECLVMALTIGYRTAEQLGLRPVGYRHFLPLVSDAGQILANGRWLAEGNDHPDVQPEETHCYLGINYQEWVDELGEAGALARYVEQGRQGFMPVRFMGQVIDALQPGVVVTTSTPRSEEAGIRAARARGIPTLTMVDLFAPPSDPFLRRPVHADCITVVSAPVKEAFIAAGMEPEHIAVTGSPDFDELFERAATQAAARFLEERGWAGKRIVMWAGYKEPSGPGIPQAWSGIHLGIAVEKHLRAWVSRQPGFALVVRYHPGQYHEFPNLGSQDRVHLSIPGGEPLLPALVASDIVINQVSTVGLQAALLGKRVLNLGFSPSVANVDFDLGSFGPNETVASPDALVAVLESSCRPPGAARMTLPEGPSAPRVANEVLGLLARSQA